MIFIIHLISIQNIIIFWLFMVIKFIFYNYSIKLLHHWNISVHKSNGVSESRTEIFRGHVYTFSVILTSSGTARILLNPLRNTTNTLRAPQRRAEVAQSKAVSPAPSTTTVPWILGNWAEHKHDPVSRGRDNAL